MDFRDRVPRQFLATDIVVGKVVRNLIFFLGVLAYASNHVPSLCKILYSSF